MYDAAFWIVPVGIAIDGALGYAAVFCTALAGSAIECDIDALGEDLHFCKVENAFFAREFEADVAGWFAWFEAAR